MRVLAWFSCGSASALAAKLAADAYGDRCEVVYCDTLEHEHPDNRRFLADVERWIGKPVTILKSEKYTDIYDVFDKTGWLVGPAGARCTTELKKNVRKAYQRVDDLHVFGFTGEEQIRVDRFKKENPEIDYWMPLHELGWTKAHCHQSIAAAGIEQPMMYKLGYKNNNCIGCVKGQKGYWNKIRRDFPYAFDRMAEQERKMGVAICSNEKRVKVDGKVERIKIPLFLDKLPPNAGRREKAQEMECGVLCTS